MSGLVTQMKSIPPPNKKTTPTTEVCTAYLRTHTTDTHDRHTHTLSLSLSQEYLERFNVLEISAKVLYILVNIVKVRDSLSLSTHSLTHSC